MLLANSGANAAGPPEGEVRLQPARWRTTRQVLQRSAEQAGFRFCVPATVSRRAFVGSVDEKAVPAAALLQEVCKQTGLTSETLGGVVVLHAPKVDRLKELTGRLNSDDERARPAAARELGWLQDARAWPELARAAVGKDTALALAAAQALRRLDGEKPLDWRYYGVSDSDPELGDMQKPPAAWQAPMGLAFPNCVPVEAVEALAGSSYIPLREAAARLTAGLGEKGKALAERLAGDPSLIVSTAAKRTLAAWAAPEKAPPPPYKAQPIDLQAAAEQIKGAKEHDTVWRTVGRRAGQLGTPEAIKIFLDYAQSGGKYKYLVSIPLAEWCGGPEVIEFLKAGTVVREHYSTIQGWSLWGLTALQDGSTLAESLRPALESLYSHWTAPPEYTAAQWAGPPALKLLLDRMEKRGHWACLAAGYIGGPEAVEALIARLESPDAGTAIAAAKGLGDTAALAAVKPLIGQLKHADRLRRHWAVLGLGRIGGPEAAKALADLLADEAQRKDRLVRAAAAVFLKEIGPVSPEAATLIADFEAEDRNLLPEYRPRNKKFDDSFPVNTEVYFKEHAPKTYSSIGETRVVMDWANRLMVRYGGCTDCYGNEFFAFDVGSGTWFPLRAPDHFSCFFNEVRPNPGCSRGMAYDGLNKLVWIGAGIGGVHGPVLGTNNLNNGLAAYDPVTDRFVLAKNARRMPQVASGEPHKFMTFDYATGLVIGSKSSARGIGVVDVRTMEAALRPGPEGLPDMDQYPPPVFACDPTSRLVMCTHPKLNWRLLLFDAGANTFRWSEAKIPGTPSDGSCGGLVYDCMNQAMILVGGGKMPTCLYDRKADKWVDLEVKDLGTLAGRDNSRLCAYDPEHNVVLSLRGGAYRYKAVPAGTKGSFGERGNPPNRP